uniref:BZIP domain-containing protein n=1 Tax=Erythrolobus australicus TaxID=1077150 RepID=A0A7S1TNA5_9RHOD
MSNPAPMPVVEDDSLAGVYQLNGNMLDELIESMPEVEDAPVSRVDCASQSEGNGVASLYSEADDPELVPLEGTTAVAVKNMSPQEREIVLLKRKLRNRESARRSREKKDITVQSLLRKNADLERLIGSQKSRIAALRKSNAELRDSLAHPKAR